MPNATRLEWFGKYAAILSAVVAMAVGIGQLAACNFARLPAT
jgi:hypothetical protein